MERFYISNVTVICTYSRTSWFCRASVSHVVRLITIIYFPKTSEKGSYSGLQTSGRTIRQHFSGKARNAPDRKTAADWVRSVAVCCCFPRPSPARPNVGGRTPLTKRALSVCCFRLFTCRLTSKLRHARMFVSVLPLLLFFKWRPRGGCGGSSRLLLSVHRARFDFTGTSRDSTAISPRKVKLDTMTGGMSG